MARFGEYELLLELGQGGMADVFLAVSSGQVTQGFSKLLVLKRLRANLAEDPDFVAMLIDEARLAARLNHPNVVQTNEIGEVNGQYFMAMEYLEGQPLNRILNRLRSPEKGKGYEAPPGLFYSALVEVLAGLHYAHELVDFDGTPLNVVHRDVSPQNVFITYAGQVKVVDFGIAKAAGRIVETREGIIKGKISYMAPEQAIGKSNVDRRADVFAVGVMLWEIAANKRMWKGSSDLEIMHRLLAGEGPRSPREVDPNVPEAIDAICKKALAPDPANRYATAHDMQVDLEKYLRTSGTYVGPRDVGQFISALYADRRSETRKIIEARLHAISRASHDDLSLDPPQLAPASDPSASASYPATRGDSSSSFKAAARPSTTRPMSAAAGASGAAIVDVGTMIGPAATVESETIVGTVTSSSASRGKLKQRAVFAVLAASAVLAALGWLVVHGMSNGSTSTETPVSSADPHVVTPPPPGAGEMSVMLRAQPPETRFKIDDGPTLENPFMGKYPLDHATHVVRAFAPGYVDRQRDVLFASDIVLDLTLDKAPTAARPTAAPTGGGNGSTTASSPHGFGATGRDDGKRHPRPIDTAPPF